MAQKATAGLLLYRYCDGDLEIFLVHPGGPYWTKKDTGAWSIPKGELEEDENPLEAAKREFAEETGFAIDGEFHQLDPLKQRSGKIVHAWAVEADCDAARVRSNLFALEWPPKSGRMQKFPEVDRAQWFSVPEARKRIITGQTGFIDQLISILK